MGKRKQTRDFTGVKYFGVPEASEYYAIGRQSLIENAKKIGAFRKLGGRVLIDKSVMDMAIDSGAAASQGVRI